MKTKTVPIDDAIGLPLSHDLTKISVEEGFKGARFKKGHILEISDLEILRSMGRHTLTVLELEENEVHEDDASMRLADIMKGENVKIQGPGEGKCSLIATSSGLLDLNPESIGEINGDPQWAIATLPLHVPVSPGEIVASFRVLPLVISEPQMRTAEKAAAPISVLPYTPKSVALINTGRELAEGRIKDSFAPKLEEKIKPYGGTLTAKTVVTDDKEAIVAAIDQMMDRGAEIVICTGGMSVDADDITSSAIRSASTEILFKGIPILPGCHLMLAKKGKVPIIGVPAGAVFEPLSSLDLILPRIFAGALPTSTETRKWGVGGLCRRCKICNFPNCGFAAR